MIKRVALSAILLLFLSCPVLPGEKFWAQATFVKGDVKVKPSGAASLSGLKLGDVLRKGDTVITGEKSKASFLVSDGSIKVVTEKSTVIMAPSRSEESASLRSVADNLSRSLLSREGNNPMLKHLGGLRGGGRNVALAPNKTRVRPDHIVLRWLPVPGVKKYSATLMGPDDNMIESSSETTSVNVPSENLFPGTTYYWEIRSSAEKDSVTALGSGSFTTLDRSEYEAVRSLEKSILSVITGNDQEKDASALFILYQVYREHGMNLDALGVLEKMNTLRGGEDQEILRLRKELCKELDVDEGSVAAITQAP